MKIELHAIELYAYHGAFEQERQRGQRFLVDVELAVGERGATDRLVDAVDYRDVVACVREVSDAQAYRLLEGLATALAETLYVRFGVASVRVRVRKPEVVLDPPVDFAAVVAERP
jgi:dihydroneopterin aldolase